MGAQHKQPDRFGRRTREHVAQGEEIAQALGHLLAVRPAAFRYAATFSGEVGARKSAHALRALVLVMRKYQVRAAAVNVEILRRDSATTSHCTRYASRGGRAPTGCSTPASSACTRASTARNRPGCACRVRLSTRAPATSSSGRTARSARRIAAKLGHRRTAHARRQRIGMSARDQPLDERDHLREHVLSHAVRCRAADCRSPSMSACIVRGPCAQVTRRRSTRG